MIAPGNVLVRPPTARLSLKPYATIELKGPMQRLLEQLLKPSRSAFGAGPGAWSFYDNFHLWIADGTFDLDGGGAFTMALFQSTSNANTSTNSLYGDLTNEVANANGYTTGGAAIPGIAWTISVATAKFTGTGTIWTASGAGISTVRFAVIYLNATSNGHVKPLICRSLLDTAPADLPTIAAGNTLTITPSASGIFTLTG